MKWRGMQGIGGGRLLPGGGRIAGQEAVNCSPSKPAGISFYDQQLSQISFATGACAPLPIPGLAKRTLLHGSRVQIKDNFR
jgi:hypothetical protein